MDAFRSCGRLTCARVHRHKAESSAAMCDSKSVSHHVIIQHGALSSIEKRKKKPEVGRACAHKRVVSFCTCVEHDSPNPPAPSTGWENVPPGDVVQHPPVSVCVSGLEGGAGVVWAASLCVCADRNLVIGFVLFLRQRSKEASFRKMTCGMAGGFKLVQKQMPPSQNIFWGKRWLCVEKYRTEGMAQSVREARELEKAVVDKIRKDGTFDSFRRRITEEVGQKARRRERDRGRDRGREREKERGQF